MILDFVNSQIDSSTKTEKSRRDTHPFTAKNIRELRPVFKQNWDRIFDCWLVSCSGQAVNTLLDAGFSAEEEQKIVDDLEKYARQFQEQKFKDFYSTIETSFVWLKLFSIFEILCGIVGLFFIDDFVWKVSITMFVLGCICLTYAGILNFSRRNKLFIKFSTFMKFFFEEETIKWNEQIKSKLELNQVEGDNNNVQSN